MIAQTPPKRCDTSASVREIQRQLRRYRGVRRAMDIRILRDRIGTKSKHLSRHPLERVSSVERIQFGRLRSSHWGRAVAAILGRRY
jgi:hypothetical protein